MSRKRAMPIVGNGKIEKTATIRISRGLAEGQVLQRQKSGSKVSLSGICSETAPVRVTITAKGKVVGNWRDQVAGSSAGGTFRAKITGLPSGGPYRAVLSCGAATVSVKSFYVGDVWLLAGQSNMEGVGNRQGAAKPHPLIRCFSLRREWRLATDPLHVAQESMDWCHNRGRQFTADEGERIRNQAKKGVGVGIFFAREMLRHTGVPQGLICTAHGGTSMQQWSPGQKRGGDSSFYHSMLESWRCTGQPVAGMLWYQGESDTDPVNASLYARRMARLVAAVRKDLRQPCLPWLMVQIGRYFINRDATWWNWIRDHQRLLSERIPALETVASIDLPLDDVVHIGSAAFPRLARRLACVAKRLVLGDKREKRAPRLKAIRVFGDRPSAGYVVDVEFDGVDGGLRSAGEPQGFGFLNAQGNLEPFIYKITLRGNVARLHLNAEPEQGARGIGYGLGLTPVCNITDGRDISLPAFGPVEVNPRGNPPA